MECKWFRFLLNRVSRCMQFDHSANQTTAAAFISLLAQFLIWHFFSCFKWYSSFLFTSNLINSTEYVGQTSQTKFFFLYFSSVCRRRKFNAKGRFYLYSQELCERMAISKICYIPGDHNSWNVLTACFQYLHWADVNHGKLIWTQYFKAICQCKKKHDEAETWLI